MAILFHRFVIGHQERTLHRRFGCAYAEVRAEGTALDPPPAAPRLSRMHQWVLDHSYVSPPGSGPLPGRAYSPPGPARPRVIDPACSYGCGEPPEHPDLGSHAAARPRPPIRTIRRLAITVLVGGCLLRGSRYQRSRRSSSPVCSSVVAEQHGSCECRARLVKDPGSSACPGPVVGA